MTLTSVVASSPDENAFSVKVDAGVKERPEDRNFKVMHSSFFALKSKFRYPADSFAALVLMLNSL